MTSYKFPLNSIKKKEILIHVSAHRNSDNNLTKNESSNKDPEISRKMSNNSYVNDDTLKDIRETNNITIVLKSYLFKSLESIGKGSYGEILKIESTVDQSIKVAKIVHYDNSNSGNIIKELSQLEIETIFKLKHINIIQLYLYKKFQNGLLSILEYAKKGDLYKYSHNKPMPENLAFAFFQQIYEGAKYLNEKNIEHRDLKLENIVITEDCQVKICDFGLAKLKKTENERCENLGSPFCLSPEAVKKDIAPFGSVDIWSLGCILYGLIKGKYPLENKNVKN